MHIVRTKCSAWLDTVAEYRKRELIVILFLGFSSGLPLAITGGTLGAWLKEAGVTLTSIGLFASVATPYALKFLWSPLIDGLRVPFFCDHYGRRRGWLLATQFAVGGFILAMSFADPAINPWFTALAALMVAIASASQDIVIDAYRVEVLRKEQYGHGAAMITLGYRIGMLASGAGALYLAEVIGWRQTYLVMAAMMGVGIVTALLAREPEAEDAGVGIQDSEHAAPLSARLAAWGREHILAPFRDFSTHRGWVAILLFIVLYKLGDAFLGIMTNPFLLEIGFTKPQIAEIVKIYGFVATILGSFIGASLVQRYGTYGPLLLCGFFHALTNLMFLAQAHAGADEQILMVGISLENLTGGMSAAVFIAFISALCRVQYTATQYALLSSLAVLGRTTLSSAAGWFADAMGWEWFFVLCVLLAFPSLALLAWMKRVGMVESSPPHG